MHRELANKLHFIMGFILAEFAYTPISYHQPSKTIILYIVFPQDNFTGFGIAAASIFSFTHCHSLVVLEMSRLVASRRENKTKFSIVTKLLENTPFSHSVIHF